MKKLLLLLLFVPLSLFGDWVSQNSELTITDDICFVDTLEGWVVGRKGDTTAIIYTSDGGGNWEVQYRDTIHIYELSIRHIKFKNELEGWAGGSEGGAGSKQACLFHTEDGGNTWNGGIIWKTKQLGKNYFFSGCVQDIDIPDSTCGFVLVDEYHMYIPQFTSHIKSLFRSVGNIWWYDEPGCMGKIICFVDSLHGWYFSEDCYFDSSGHRFPLYLLFATTQGVDSGSFELIDSFPVSINGMDFVDTLKGWVVADSGTILHTQDGGYNWVPQSSGIMNNLCGVDFLDSLNGWVVGAGGIILRTRDGGNNWAIESSPVSVNLCKVCFVDTSHGWAVGDSGKILCYRGYGIEEDYGFQIADSRLWVEPNPFGRVTSIRYWVSGSQGQETFPTVSLKIYDIIGRVVEVLVDSEVEPGHYAVEWNAKRLPSGIYFANFVTPTNRNTKKLILTH